MTWACSLSAASAWTLKASAHSASATLELLPLIIEAQKARRGHGIDGPLGHADGPGVRLFHQFLAGHEVGVAAQQDIGSAAGHVGGDGDHAEPSGLGHDFGLALVELGVEHDVAHALALQDAGKQFALLDGGCADEDGLLFLMQDGDVVGDGFIFFLGGAIDDVGFSMRNIGLLVGMTTISSL